VRGDQGGQAIGLGAAEGAVRALHRHHREGVAVRDLQGDPRISVAHAHFQDLRPGDGSPQEQVAHPQAIGGGFGDQQHVAGHPPRHQRADPDDAGPVVPLEVQVAVAGQARQQQRHHEQHDELDDGDGAGHGPGPARAEGLVQPVPVLLGRQRLRRQAHRCW
jgi:hypothetical protein